MKNEKIISAWNEIKSSEETKQEIFDKIQQESQPQRKRPVIRFKPALAAAIIIVMLAGAAAATAPRIINLDLPATIRQDNINYIPGLEHEIIIESVSISPSGNILTITQKSGENELIQELFGNFFVVDDKGNYYTLADFFIASRRNREETYTVEFNGKVPPDAQYLKIIPYNFKPIPEILADPNGNKPGEEGFDLGENDPRELYLDAKARISELPYSFKQNDYGNVIIESCVVTDENITVVYKCEGMVKPPSIVVTDGEKGISPSGQLAHTDPVYDRDTDLYTLVFNITRPVKPAMGLKVIQYDIELLEDQAVIIPLK